MKKINLLVLGLMFSLVILAGVVGYRGASAQNGNLGCLSLSNCLGEAACNGPGTTGGCRITCQGEEIIDCPKKAGGGDS